MLVYEVVWVSLCVCVFVCVCVWSSKPFVVIFGMIVNEEVCEIFLADIDRQGNYKRLVVHGFHS